MASLNETIRNEFNLKLADEKIAKFILDNDLKEAILISSIEALLPDQDWKTKKDDQEGLIRVNRTKLINKITQQLS